jgi:hypothetical protein
MRECCLVLMNSVNEAQSTCSTLKQQRNVGQRRRGAHLLVRQWRMTEAAKRTKSTSPQPLLRWGRFTRKSRRQSQPFSLQRCHTHPWQRCDRFEFEIIRFHLMANKSHLFSLRRPEWLQKLPECLLYGLLAGKYLNDVFVHYILCPNNDFTFGARHFSYVCYFISSTDGDHHNKNSLKHVCKDEK